MPRRPPTRGRGDPDPNALFDDDSDEGESAPLSAAERPREPTDTEVDDAKLPWDARLVVEKGDYAGKVLKLGGGIAMIGRSSKCELSLKGSSGVSRRHCKVQLVNDRYVVIDLESRNGTVVNGETVSRKFLGDGDLLEIGDEHMRFIAKPRAGAKLLAPPPIDSDDIEDQPTALASPIGVPQPLVKPTPPTNASATTPKKSGGSSKGPTPDGNTARKTSPEKPSPRPAGAQPAAKKPPPLPPADLPSDQTASFVMDPAFLTSKASTSLSVAAAREAMGGNTLENQPPEPPEPPDLPERDDEPSAPYTLQPPQKRRSGGVIVALLVMVLLVLGLVAVAAWDVMFAERRVVALLRSRAPAAAVFIEKNVPYLGGDDVVPVDAVDAGPTPATDAGVVAVAEVDAGVVVAEIVDAGAKNATNATNTDAGSVVVADTIVDAGSKPVATGEVIVGASSAGRVATVRVKAGDVVKKGQTLALLEAAGGLRRKLESLREEERAFEAAVKKGNKAARRDLEQVRADIAELARKTRGAPLVSDADGTVVDVRVREGATLKAGDPVVTLRN